MKKLFVLFMGVLLMLSLVACSGQAAPAVPASPAAPATPASPAAPATPTAPAAKSNEYPIKPVVCIIPYTAGGATDIAGRYISSIIPAYLGQALVIENQAGGAAIPGTLSSIKAKPDGYTLGYNWMASFILRPQIMDTGYSFEDATFICGITLQHTAIFVRAESPFKTLEDLVKYALANPGKLTYSGGAANSWQQMVMGALNLATKMDTVHVPYDGARQAALGTLSGELDFCVVEVPTAAAELAAGTMRMLVTFENKRFDANTPTLNELGYDMDATMQRSIILGPAGMDQKVVDKLANAFKSVCEDETFLGLAKKSQLDVQWVDGETVRKEIQNSYAKMTPVIEKYMK